jgi:HTH-type transcriptional regulator/antitoxin HigA
MEDRAFIPAETFPPGEYIKDEIEARGWSQADLAEIMGRSPKLVSAIIAGSSSITPETAQALGEAFGTSAQVWMNLDAAYRLWKLHPDARVARRARLYAKGPIKEMIHRRFIEPSEDLDVLERRIQDFFELESIEDQPQFAYAARKATSYAETTPAQYAWLYRAKALAKAVPVSRPYAADCFKEALVGLRSLMANAEDIYKIPSVLGAAGIRLVVVEPLAGVKIDGVTFWLDESSPVIALSMRYGRIDWFWFVVLHEMDHVGHREDAIDVQLVGKDAVPSQKKSPIEQRADMFAADFEISRPQLDSFIARVAPLYSKVRIAGFAATLGLHPGLVVGRLQHDGQISYAHSRDMLTDIRHLVVGAALTDGWGESPRLGTEG